MNRYHIRYYAMLREMAGTAEESVESRAATAAELFDELARRHHFRFRREQLKAAVNGTMVTWQSTLKDNDRIALLPPFSGG